MSTLKTCIDGIPDEAESVDPPGRKRVRPELFSIDVSDPEDEDTTEEELSLFGAQPEDDDTTEEDGGACIRFLTAYSFVA